MAYSQSDLNLITPVMGLGTSNTAQVWTHVSTEEVATVIAAYITNGDDIGMRVNDIVYVIDTDLPSLDVCLVTAIAAGGAVTMVNFT